MSILETPEAAGTDSGARPASPPARAHVEFITLPASCRPGGLGEEEPPEACCPGGNLPPPAVRPASTNHTFPPSTWSAENQEPSAQLVGGSSHRWGGHSVRASSVSVHWEQDGGKELSGRRGLQSQP